MWIDQPPLPSSEVMLEQCTSLHEDMIHIRESQAEGLEMDKENKSGDFGAIRTDAIRAEGTSVGARAGLAWRYSIYAEILQKYENKLDNAYNFRGLQTEYLILPPVIEQANESFRGADDGQQARTAAVTWRIISPAKIVANPPSWRDYMLESFAPPISEDINFGLQPITEMEQRWWHKNMCVGYAAGVKQADATFIENLSRLTRDFEGILRYRLLATQGVVTMPVMKQGRLGITYAGKELFVDDRIYTIEKGVEFTNYQAWSAIPLAPDSRQIGTSPPPDILPPPPPPPAIVLSRTEKVKNWFKDLFSSGV